MSVYDEVRHAVESELDMLESVLLELNNSIQSSYIDGLVWSIPAPDLCDKTSLTVERNAIYPLKKTGPDAGEFASRFFGELYFEIGKSPIYANRAPGIIRVGADAIVLANKANAAKTNIREIIINNVETGSRRRFVRDILKKPKLNLNYVYRQIKFIPEGTEVVRFMWEGKQVKHNRLTAQEIHNLCDRARGLSMDEAWHEAIQRVRDAADNNATVVRRAQQPPKPRARMKVCSGETSTWESMDASTPFLTTQELPLIHNLDPWKEPSMATDDDDESGTARKRKPRSDRGNYQLLFGELGLFTVV